MELIGISGSGNAQTPMFRSLELRYVIDFVSNDDMSEEIGQNKLQALWTAYCLHQDLDVDTHDYDNDLLTLWNRMQETGMGASAWENYEAFDSFMGALLC